MKKIIAAFVLFFLPFSMTFAGQDHDNKVTICHATGSESNPFVTIHISENATSGHENHDGDLFFDGEVDCPTPVIEPPSPPSPPPPPQEPPVDDVPPPTDTTPPDNTPSPDSSSTSSHHSHHHGGGTKITLPVCLPIINGPTTVDTGVVGDGVVDFHFNIQNATTVVIFYGYPLGNWTDMAISSNDSIETIAGLTVGEHYWFEAVGISSCTVGWFTEPIDPLP